MEVLRWLFELRDAISGPARKMAQSLRETRAGLDEVNSGVKPVQTGFSGLVAKAGIVAKGIAGITLAVIALAKAALFLHGTGFFKELPGLWKAFRRDGFKGLRGAVGGASDRMSTNFFDQMGLNPKNLRRIGGRVLAIGAALGVAVGAGWALSAAFGAISRVVSRVASAVSDLTQRFTRGVVEARLFRDRTVAAFATITGSDSRGLEITNQVRELAHFMGTDLRSTAKSVQSLMAGGFDQARAFEIFQAVEDLRVIDPDASADNITRAIRQIRSKGVLQMEELQGQLADTGVNVEDVLSRIGANLGISSDEVRAKITAREISSAMGIQGILDSIQARAGGGPLGALGRERSMGLGGLMRRLKNAPALLFDAIAASSDGAFAGLRDVLKQINELLDPTSMSFKSLVKVLGLGFQVIAETMRTAWEIGKALFEGIFGETGGDAVTSISGALATMRDVIAGLRTPEALAFFRKLGVGLRVAGKFLWPIIKGLGILTVVLGGIVAFFVGGGLAVMFAPITAIVAGLGLITTAVTEIVTRAPEWGRNIIEGLVQGIQGALGWLRETATSIGTTVKSAVVGTLKIGSPSRVMEELGQWTGIGFTRGLDASMPDLNRMAAPAPRLGRPGGAGPYRTPGGTNVGGIHIEVNVEGGGQDPEGLADAIRRILLSELEGAFEQLAIEQGVG